MTTSTSPPAPTPPTTLSQPPVLSTPETHIFEDPTPTPPPKKRRKRTEKEIWEVYEVERTAKSIVDGGWRVVALQFPDGMVGEGVKVFEALEGELAQLEVSRLRSEGGCNGRRGDGEMEAQREKNGVDSLETDVLALEIAAREKGNGLEGKSGNLGKEEGGEVGKRKGRIRLYILADTSYSSCCVDEIAAEHVSADVIVHYGRSCLSPTARLPVIHVFTREDVEVLSVVQAFEETFSENEGKIGKEERVVLIGDVTMEWCMPQIYDALREKGYTSVLRGELVHDPGAEIPNRKVQLEEGLELKDYSVFYVAEPPQALLLTLHSRVKDLHIYNPETNSVVTAESSRALRRRYAVLTSLATCGTWGILINTLSVKDHMEVLERVKELIRAKGKKYYVFVVGKVNPEKVANFSEIDGWVVVGCWESSLVDMDNGEGKRYWKGMVTPWELEWILSGVKERVWDGWRGDFKGLLEHKLTTQSDELDEEGGRAGHANGIEEEDLNNDADDSEPESEPPEFDLRTGRYVSHSRPMRTAYANKDLSADQSSAKSSQALTARAKGDLATVNGAVSTGAEYLRNQRTWMGLGSDFHEGDAETGIQEGRKGVARGYVVGDAEQERR